MPRVCAICGKRTISGNTVSHSHLKTRRKWLPNVKKTRVVIDGKIRRIYVCTRCLRSGKIEKVV